MNENVDNDILQELTESEINELCLMYKEHKEKLPHLYSFLVICTKLKNMELEAFVKIYSPGQCWREDGTFVAILPEHGCDIILHTFDPLATNLLNAIAKTKRIKYQDKTRNFTVLYAMHENFANKLPPLITEVFKCKLDHITLQNLFCLRKEHANDINLVKPPEVTIRKLDPNGNDFQIIKENWAQSFPEAEQKLKKRFKISTGYGVYLKSDNKLVSWVTGSNPGLIGALQTLEGYQRRGYAALALEAMAKELAEKGFDSCATVLVGNRASEVLFEKLGFRKIHKCLYVWVLNKE